MLLVGTVVSNNDIDFDNDDSDDDDDDDDEYDEYDDCDLVQQDESDSDGD